MTRRTSALALLLFLGTSVAVALVGGLATAEGVTNWYPTLDKPPWNPPNWVFGPIWTTLYTAMAFAAWDVVRKEPGKVWPMAFYGVQIVLNAMWSPIFFAQHDTGTALLVILGMWLSIAACIRLFWPISRLSAVLMMPYLLWVSIATSLNAWIWWFN